MSTSMVGVAIGSSPCLANHAYLLLYDSRPVQFNRIFPLYLGGVLTPTSANMHVNLVTLEVLPASPSGPFQKNPAAFTCGALKVGWKTDEGRYTAFNRHSASDIRKFRWLIDSGDSSRPEGGGFVNLDGHGDFFSIINGSITNVDLITPINQRPYTYSIGAGFGTGFSYQGRFQRQQVRSPSGDLRQAWPRLEFEITWKGDWE